MQMPTKKNTPIKKKTTVKTKKADLKTKPTAKSVTAFINTVENETRKRDAKTLLAMMKRITGEKPKMWGPTIIGFGTYHYVYETGREGDMLQVGFSPRKASMVLYVLGSPNDAALLKKLGKHKHGKSCLYINKLEDVDLDVLEELIDQSFNTEIKYWGGC